EGHLPKAKYGLEEIIEWIPIENEIRKEFKYFHGTEYSPESNQY
ncbi:811_t:CDS:1, partial [Scutellospora calospora]